MTSGTRHLHRQYDQAGDANYNAAPQVTETVNAQKADQTITVTTHAPASAAYNASFAVAATAPGGAVSFSSSGACTNTGAHVHDDQRHRHLLGQVRPGRQRELQRRAAGDRVGHGARRPTRRSSSRSTRRRAPSSTTSFTVAASGGGSGNAVTFSSGGACSNTGDTFTMTSGTGTCTVKLRPGRRRELQRRAAGDRVGHAQKASQTINVTTHAPASRRLQPRSSPSRQPAAARATRSPSPARAPARTRAPRSR